MGMIVASITAFLVGQLVDAYTFHWLIDRYLGMKKSQDLIEIAKDL
jgi:uncharacterized PurR-regulated membrane protein YhhQ (DUF165 family)